QGLAHRHHFDGSRRRARWRARRLHRRGACPAGDGRGDRSGGRRVDRCPGAVFAEPGQTAKPRPAMMRKLALSALAGLLLAGLGACEPVAVDDRPETARDFPRAYRPVSEPGGTEFSTEQVRDDRNEANTVM